MLAIILSVIVISLSGVMMPGPMFAVAVAKSYHSLWAGTKMSLGHAVIEVPIILLIYYGFARFFQHNVVQIVLSLIGGAVIIWLGINMFRARKEVAQGGKDLKYGAWLPVMIVVHWLCDLAWLTFVSVLIYRTKGLWGLKLQEWIFAVCSLLLVGFGVWYLISGIQKF